MVSLHHKDRRHVRSFFFVRLGLLFTLLYTTTNSRITAGRTSAHTCTIVRALFASNCIAVRLCTDLPHAHYICQTHAHGHSFRVRLPRYWFSPPITLWSFAWGSRSPIFGHNSPAYKVANSIRQWSPRRSSACVCFSVALTSDVASVQGYDVPAYEFILSLVLCARRRRSALRLLCDRGILENRLVCYILQFGAILA